MRFSSDAISLTRLLFRLCSLVLAVLILLPGPSAATAAEHRHTTLQGILTDDQGTPLAGAEVRLLETDQAVITDEQGQFRFTGLEEGIYNLLATHSNQGSELVATAATGHDILQLQFLPQFREEIVVTGTRSEKRLSETPVRTELIKRDEIESSAARTLADAVEFTTGVRVESDCQNCNFSQIRLLGLDGAYSQILIDSQPLLSSLAAVYGVEQIPARMIDRIEVVKGGGSAMYGPGSVGGVINVIPREPVTSGGIVETRLEWMDGTPGHAISAAADVVSRNGDTAFSIFGQVDKIRPVDLTGDGFTEVALRDFQAIGMRFGQFLLDGDGRLTLDYNHTEEDRRGGDNLHLPEFMAWIAESVQSTRDTGSIGWVHAAGTAFDYRLSASFSHTSRDSYYGAGMDPDAYGTTDNPLYVVDSQFNHRLGRHTVSWGGQFSSDHLEDEQPAYGRFIDETYTNAGIFLQDDWEPNPGWELVYGLRADKHSEMDNMVISPRTALKWSPHHDLTARFSVASGFRAPQIFDEDLHITQVGGEGQIIRNHPDLEEERSLSYTAGLEWNPETGFGKSALVEINFFLTRIEDLFFVTEDDDPVTPETEFTRINLGGARVSGAELNLGYDIRERLNVTAGWVEQSAEYDDPDPDFGQTDFYRTPDRYGVFTVFYQNPKLADLFVGLRYTGSMKVPHYAGYVEEDRLEESGTYFTIDVSLSRGFNLGTGEGRLLTATVGAKNLTDQFQEDLDQGPDRDSGYVYGPRFPRTVYVSLSYEF